MGRKAAFRPARRSPCSDAWNRPEDALLFILLDPPEVDLLQLSDPDMVNIAHYAVDATGQTLETQRQFSEGFIGGIGLGRVVGSQVVVATLAWRSAAE
jgi:hypothetical protein